ncbi:MAG: hypothetical protein HY821_00315 [Acidobacteria bacterium]|nr:hypothetical protein [Acidobacteriota bacterium]
MAGDQPGGVKPAESALSGSGEDVRSAAIKDSSAAVVFPAANALFLLQDPGAYKFYCAVLAGEKKSAESLMEPQMKRIKDPKALAWIGLEAGSVSSPSASAIRPAR